jgi:hypothetical protein
MRIESFFLKKKKKKKKEKKKEAQIAQPKEAQVAHFSFIFGHWPIIYNLSFVVLSMPILAFVVLFKTETHFSPCWLILAILANAGHSC